MRDFIEVTETTITSRYSYRKNNNDILLADMRRNGWDLEYKKIIGDGALYQENKKIYWWRRKTIINIAEIIKITPANFENERRGQRNSRIVLSNGNDFYVTETYDEIKKQLEESK